LRKNPGFACVVVITLALGIGANTAIYSFVNAVILNPLPFPDADRLVVISEISKEGAEIGVSLPNFQDWQVRAKSFEEIGGYRFDTFNLSGMGSPQRLVGQEVTLNYFRILGVQPQFGSNFHGGGGEVHTGGNGRTHQRFPLADYLWLGSKYFGKDPKSRRLRLLGNRCNAASF
jgi:hypothetical protein